MRKSGAPVPCGPGPFVSLTVGVGNNEHPEPVVAGAEVGCANAVPFRIEPEIGQVSENTAKCSQNSPSVSGTSHTSRAVFQAAIGVG